jgi:pimeloyl-ACP methyl ester carboxylesterase
MTAAARPADAGGWSSAPAELDPYRFAVHHANVADGISIAFVREGVGGVPLVLMHGWPSTKRLFWRTIAPLAEAGFDVIVPDARGFGDSTRPEDPSQFATFPSVARDVAELLRQLGHRRAVLAGGDMGSGIVQQLSMAFPELAVRQVIWNGSLPGVPEVYAAAGVPGNQRDEIAEISDHLREHGLEADALVARLATPEACRAYIAAFYTGRVWRRGEAPRHLAAPGAFGEASAAFMSEPFADRRVLRSSLALYEAISQPDRFTEPVLLNRVNDTTETLVLYGEADEIVRRPFITRAAVAFGKVVGPFIVPGAGHFVPWEAPEVFVSALRTYCRDLLG